MDEYFENGYHIDRYHALEEDLLTFLNYVTLEFYPKPQNQKYIKSIYLADLMLRIGSNISIFFDKFIEDHVISGDVSVASSLYSQEESHEARKELREIRKKNLSNPKWQGWNLGLSDRKVLLIPLNEIIYPFRHNGKREGKSWTEINADNTAFWWNSYNKIKHNAVFNGANLNNVLQALAALFLLFISTGLIYTEKSGQYDYVRTHFDGTLFNQKISTKLFSKESFKPI